MTINFIIRFSLIFVIVVILLSGCKSSKSDWEMARKDNSIEAYSEFLKEYSQEDSAELAKTAILNLSCMIWPPKDSILTFLKTTNRSNFLRYDCYFRSSGIHGVNTYWGIANPKDFDDIKVMYQNFKIKIKIKSYKGMISKFLVISIPLLAKLKQ